MKTSSEIIKITKHSENGQMKSLTLDIANGVSELDVFQAVSMLTGTMIAHDGMTEEEKAEKLKLIVEDIEKNAKILSQDMNMKRMTPEDLKDKDEGGEIKVKK